MVKKARKKRENVLFCQDTVKPANPDSIFRNPEEQKSGDMY